LSSRVINEKPIFKIKRKLKLGEKLVVAKSHDEALQTLVKYKFVLIPEHLEDIIEMAKKMNIEHEVIKVHTKKIKYLATKNIISVGGDVPISEVGAIMVQYEISSVVVRKLGIPVGIITQGDIIRKVVMNSRNSSMVKAEEIMSQPLITIDGEEDMVKAAIKMKKKGVKRLIVTDSKENVIGIITQTGIVKALAVNDKLLVKSEKAIVN